MNVAQVGRRGPARLAAASVGLLGLGLLVRAAVVGARLEAVLLALALLAGASVVALLTDRAG